MKTVESVKEYCPPTETVQECPLCRGEAADLLFSNFDRLYRLPGEFALVCCSDCGLVCLSPRPVLDELGYYYPTTEYYSYQVSPDTVETPRSSGKLHLLRDRIRQSVMSSMGYPAPGLTIWQRALKPLFIGLFRNRVPYGYGERFPRHKPGGRALDIGCGSGLLLSFLKSHGWQVAGVELSAAAALAAKQAYGIEVFVGALRDAPFGPASFDYIHMSHVIEHLPDPVASLRIVESLLKPGGTLYVETPNIDSFGRRRCGRHWLAWETPRHLCLFTPTTLRRAMAEAHLKVKRLRTSVESYYEWREFYRREERGQRRPADYVPFQDPFHLGFAARCRARLLTLAAHLSHMRNPLDGDTIRCWATKD